MSNDPLTQIKKDMEFLMSFAPSEDPKEVQRGLAPMMYFTGTYEGDLELAQRTKEIKERYNIVSSDEQIEEDSFDLSGADFEY